MNNLKARFILGLIFYLFCSCQRETIEKNKNGTIHKIFYTNFNNKLHGKFKEFDKNGILIKSCLYNDGTLIDSVVYFKDNTLNLFKKIHKDTLHCTIFKNSNLYMKGLIVKKMKFGTWIVYRNNKQVQAKLEYINLCESEYLNQIREFDIKQKIIPSKCNYFDIQIFESYYNVGDTINLKINYKSSMNHTKSNLFLNCNKIFNDFCNAEDVMLNQYRINKRGTFNMNFIFKTKGVKNMRGFIEEQYLPKNSTKIKDLKTVKTFINFDVIIR